MARKKKVQVWLYRKTEHGPEYLLLKRPPNWRSGEFWQPVTGSMEKGETPLEAGRREIQEETGIADLFDPIDTGLVCLFEQRGVRYKEFILAFETSDRQLTLSSEHEDCGWFDFMKAHGKLHFTSNQAGLGAVHALIRYI